MRQLVDRIVARHGLLHGVIQAAGVLRDRTLWAHTSASLTEVLRPKVHGTWALLAATEHLTLDFVLVCSSMSALLGGTGHATYAAASAVQDAMALQRRYEGKRVALTIDWGAWGESRAAQIEGYQQAMRQSGIRPLSHQDSLAALARAMELNRPRLGVIDLMEAPSAHEDSVARVSRAASRIVESLQREMNDEIAALAGLDQLLDRLVGAYVAEAFAGAGLFLQSEERLDLHAIARRWQLAPLYARLLPRFLKMLVEDGMLVREATVYRSVRGLNDSHQSKTLFDELRRRYPQLRSQFELLDRCGSQLADVLTGKRDPLELLFPGGSTAEAETLYAESPAPRFCSRLAGQAMAAWLATRDPHGLRLLEVGAGTVKQHGTSARPSATPPSSTGLPTSLRPWWNARGQNGATSQPCASAGSI